ncbi:MAG: DUF2971 domain-containing protein [Gordonia sp. (in: high G+C Gram-positive bacteria)]
MTDGKLYHYTDINALYGILTEHELWATSVKFMNDSSEGALGASQIQKAIREIREQYSIGDRARDPDAEQIVRAIDKLHGPNFLDGPYDSTEVFVACLSRACDEIGQWRAYARNGFCVEFNESKLRKSIKELNQRVVALEEVQYVREKEIKDLRKQVRKLLKKVAKVRASEFHEGQPIEALDEENKIYELGHVRKHWAFQQEKEVRIVTEGSPGNFRASADYGLIPFTKLKFAPDSIDAIWVGPNRYGDLQAASLQSFAASNPQVIEYETEEEDGYTTVDYHPHLYSVKRSSVPFRG